MSRTSGTVLAKEPHVCGGRVQGGIMTGCSLFPGATWTPLHPPSWVQKGMEVSLALPPAPCETRQVISALRVSVSSSGK